METCGNLASALIAARTAVSVAAFFFSFLYWPLAFAQEQKAVNEQFLSVAAELRKLGVKAQMTSVQSVLDTSDHQVRRLTRVSLAASVNEQMAVAELLVLFARHKGITSPKVAFADQTVAVSLNFSAPVVIGNLPSVEVKSKINAILSPSILLVSTDTNAEFKVAFAVSRLDIELVDIASNGRLLPGIVGDIARAIANSALVPVREAINRLELRLPTVASTKLNIKVPEASGLVTTVEPRELSAKIEALGIAHLIDSGRFTIVAQVGEAVRDAQWQTATFDALRNNFKKLLATAEAPWMHQGDFAVFIEGRFVENIASRLFGASRRICLHSTASNYKVPVHAKIPLPSEDTIDCAQARECSPSRECKSARDCAAETDCTPTRNCDAVKDCGGYKWYQSFDKGRCELEKSTAKLDCERIKSTEKGVCELNKGTRRANCERIKTQEKQVCEFEKAGAKGLCESLKTMGKGSCEVLKESYKRIRGGGADFANVDSDDMSLDGRADICLHSISFNSAVPELKAKLVGEAKARVTGHVRFTPLNIAGHIVCFKPFDRHINETAEIPTQSLDIAVKAVFADDPNRVYLQVAIPSTIKIRFPASAVAAKLATDPNFSFSCPLADYVLKVRAITPDRWWPAQWRGDIEKDFPPMKFELDLVRAVTDAGNQKLSGSLRHNTKGVGSVLTVKK